MTEVFAPIKEFNKTGVAYICNAIPELLKEWATTNGLIVERGSASFDSGMVTLKLNVKLAGDPDARARKEWELSTTSSWTALGEAGLKPEHFGALITWVGETYRISGYNARASKMPIQMTRISDNKVFKFSIYSVVRSLNLKENK